MLSARNVSYRIGQKAILRDVSCSLASGQLTALVGPNGAGKSTLFRMFSDELTPDSGYIALENRKLSDWPSRELAQRRAALPQENRLTFPFKVIEVVTLGRLPHSPGGESREDLEIARQTLQHVGMDGYEGRLFTTLSGGEKQRVQLARVLAQIWRPNGSGPSRILLLDEPTSNLDPAHQRETLQIARRLARRGAAVLAILHDLNLALAFADRLWAIQDGRLIADGPAVETLTPALAKQLFHIDCQTVQLPSQPRPQLVQLASA